MEDLTQFYISTKTDIRSAFMTIDKAGAKIALIVDNHKRLLGIVNDSDIRRGLLRGETLDNPVENVMQRNFRWVKTGTSKEEILRLMKDEKGISISNSFIR